MFKKMAHGSPPSEHAVEYPIVERGTLGVERFHGALVQSKRCGGHMGSIIICFDRGFPSPDYVGGLVGMYSLLTQKSDRRLQW